VVHASCDCLLNVSSLKVSSPIWIRGQQKARTRPAPGIGGRSEALLRASGFTASEIAALRPEGVIG
jgi:crotonobetainyl-CoA:carnitine CoA-transferase CaiB-like acyl-CoA transferase